MAAVKEYSYYIKGTKLALIEKDTAFDNDPNSRDYGPGADFAHWKSPLSAVEDGLEIEYVYSPEYFIKATDTVHSTITHYRSADGYFQIKGGAVNYDTTTNVDDYFVLRNAGEFNGLHRIKAFSDADGTNDQITTYTKYSGLTATSTAFEKTVKLYYAVNALNDEADIIDLPNYLSKALVYYVKARLAEDGMNLEGKEYFMKQFRKMVEKYDSTRIPGPRRMVAGSHAIR